jgi:two-component sensor histidine kinase
VVSLKALCDEFAKTEKIKVDFTARKVPNSVPQKIASGLYRIAQESMQNVAKHARAKRLSVSLAAQDRGRFVGLRTMAWDSTPRPSKARAGSASSASASAPACWRASCRSNPNQVCWLRHTEPTNEFSWRTTMP